MTSIDAGQPVSDAMLHADACEAARRAGDPGRAIRHGRSAVVLAPDHADGWYNLGISHADRLELGHAERCERCAIRLRPDHAGAHFELAEALLAGGNFSEGWGEYEWRHGLENAPPLLPEEIAQRNAPLWDGSPLRDGTLMIVADQGFGDVIQFCRFLPAAAGRCAALAVAASREMMPVLTRLPGIATLFDRWADCPSFDAWCPLSSLPRLFGVTPATIPTAPYLQADPVASAAWRRCLDGLLPNSYRRVGLVWAGRQTHPNDHNRSIDLEWLEGIAGGHGVALVTLQVGPMAEQAGSWYGQAPLLNLGPAIKSFADTMAIVANMDLVIAVDTSVAHLAGAMGRPVWVLLPYAADWRWLTGRCDSPWYPSARLFRQTNAGDWQGVFAAVAASLSDLGPIS